MEHAIRHRPAVRLAVVYAMIAMLTLAIMPSNHASGCGARPGPERVYRLPHEHPSCAACYFHTTVKLAPGACPDIVLRPVFLEWNRIPLGFEAPTLGAQVVPCANSPPLAG